MPKKRKILQPTIWDMINRRSQEIQSGIQRLTPATPNVLYSDERREEIERKKAAGRKIQEENRKLQLEAEARRKLAESNNPINIPKEDTIQQPEIDNQKTQPENSYFALLNNQSTMQGGFMPSILDPNFRNWAELQSKLDPNNPMTKIANTSLSFLESIEEDKKNGKETYSLRLDRRITESNLFGKLNKDKLLTPKEISEIVTYKAITDPVFGRLTLEDLHEYTQATESQEQAELKRLYGIKRPDNYIGEEDYYKAATAMQGMLSPNAQGFELAMWLKSFFDSKYAKSLASDFILKTNESLMEVPAGQISRSNELLDLVSRARDYKDIINEIASTLSNIQYEQTLISANNGDLLKSGAINQAMAEKRLGQYIQKLRNLRGLLSDGKLWLDANNLASWSSGGIMGKIAQYVDSIIDDDLGGIRGNLDGLGTKLDELNNLMNEKNHSPEWYHRVSSAANSIELILQGFENATEKKLENWRKQMEVDIKDINDWKNGENWLGMHAEVDNFYDAQEKILEKLNFTWKDPVRLATYGWSGIAGGSNSSWWKSIIGMSSKAIGAIGGAVTTGGTSTFILLASIAASFEADKSLGSDENNIESANKTSDKLRRSLESEGKYTDFIAEGAEQMGYNDDAKKLFENTKDAETIKRYITDMFVAGMWHSADPEISKMHADAVIGVNNQFYNDQPVNTGEAMIGSAVAIINLEPVKYLSRSTKIVGKAAGRRFANSAIGKEAALRYAGFKTGVQNVGTKAKAVEQVVRDRLIKGGERVMATKAGQVAAKGGEKISQASEWITGKVKSLGRGFGEVDRGFAEIEARMFNRVKPMFIGVEYPIAQRMALMRAFATSVPSAYMKAAETLKFGANIGTRIAIDTVSEMTQEGVQGLTQYNGDPYLNDKVGSIAPDYDVQHNRSTLERIVDDLGYASVAWLLWLHQDDPAWATDADVVGSMNATPLLTLFGPNTFLVGVQAHNLIKEYNAIDFLMQQIDAERRGDIAEIELGKYYAKHLDKQSYQKMLDRFDRIKKISGTHRKAVDRYNAWSRMMNGAENATMLDDDEHAIPDELIERQRLDYEDVYQIGNSTEAMLIAVQAGILKLAKGPDGKLMIKRPMLDLNTNKKYAELVSLINYRTNKRIVALDKLQETDEKINSVFKLDLTEDESWYDDDVDFNSTAMGMLNTAKALTRLAALLDLLNDYNLKEEPTEKEDMFKLRIISQIKELKQELGRKGIQLETKEDIIQYLGYSEIGSVLLNAVLRSGQDISEMTMADVVDGLNQWQRERALNEYDVLLQQQLYENLKNYPLDQIDAYKRARKSDAALEKILEEDYIGTIREYAKAANIDVKNNDIYVGSDNKWYITQVKTATNGKETVVKRSYNLKTGRIGNEELPFDRVEYYRAKTNERDKFLEMKRNRKQNENLATEVEDSEEKVPVESVNPEEPQEEEGAVDVVEEQPGDETTNLEKVFSTGSLVFVKNDDNTILPATVTMYDMEHNTVGVQFENGVIGIIDANKVFKPENTAFTNSSDIKVGDVVLYEGLRYRVTGAHVSNVDLDTMVASLVFVLSNGSGTIGYVSEEDLLKIDVDEEGARQEEFLKTKPNDKQREVIELLAEFKKQNEKLVKKAKGGDKKLVTAYNYFIKVGRKFLSFVRVHGVLDDIFEETDQEREKRIKVFTELTELQINRQYDVLARRIKQYLDEFNKKLKDKYGEDSNIYKRNRLDLSVYYDTKLYLQDQNTPSAVSNIVSREVPGVPVVAGSIIDTIFRDFFKNEGKILNKEEYKMSDDVFNSLYDQLVELNDYIVNTLKWVVDTTDYTWFGNMQNGVRMAGETDMIAIDEKGDIHIIDFKTTRSPNRYHRVIDPDSGKEVFNFVDEIASLNGKVGKRSYAAQYAMLLEAYRMLIQDTLPGRKVKSLLVLPIELQYEDVEGMDLEEITDTNVLSMIDLTSIPELKKYMTGVDNYLNGIEETEDSIEEELEQVNGKINSLISEINDQLITGNIEGVQVSVLNSIQSLKNRATELKEKLSKLAKTNRTEFEALSDLFDLIAKDSYLLLKEARELHAAWIDESKPDGGENNNNSNWRNEPIEEVPESENRWWHRNRLNSHTDYLRKLKKAGLKWMTAIIRPDFIKNSVFEIYRDPNDLDVFRVRVIYTPTGKSPIKFTETWKDDIELRLGNDAPMGPDRNLLNAGDSLLSTLGRNFIRLYYSLAKTLKPGEKIVAKTVTRTNGQLIYREKELNLTATQFFKDWKTKIYNLFDGENSIIGISDGERVYVKTEDQGRITIHESDYYGEYNTKIRPVLTPGNTTLDESDEVTILQNIPAGSVVFLYKFRYDEDPEGEMRTIPLVLKGRKLGKSKDIKFVIRSIQDRKSMNSNATFIAKTKNGKKREVLVNGLTNRKLILMLVRFGGLAQHANDEFIFNYATKETKDGKTVPDFSSVIVTDMTADPEIKEDDFRPFYVVDDGEGGFITEQTPELHRSVTQLDLNNVDHLKKLIEILLHLDMHINQDGIMQSKLNSEDENSWFGALGSFFKEEENDDIIEITLKDNDNIKFSREDVIPDETNDEKSLSGIGWMIKNGHATTNAESIENPLISISELGVMKESEEKQKKKKETKRKTKKETVDISEDSEQPFVEQKASRKKSTVKQSEINSILDDITDEDYDYVLDGMFGKKVARLRRHAISKEQELKIQKEVKRLLGNVNVEWSDEAIEVLQSGATVAGKAAIDGLKLSRKAPNGTHQHEIFHRILELLTPPKIREKLYAEYRSKYGKVFRETNGRELTDFDISEAFAEMWREFLINREHIRLFRKTNTKIPFYVPNGLNAIFNEIELFKQGLERLGSRNFAAMFIIANSGIFKYIRPNKKSIDRFVNILGGESNYVVSSVIKNQRKTLNLQQFPEHGGPSAFNDALEVIKYKIIRSCGIDALASNAHRIDTSLQYIYNLDRGTETTEHSAWFRVTTGEYAKPGETLTKEDIKKYIALYKSSPEMVALFNTIREENEDVSPQEIKRLVIRNVVEIMQCEYDDCDQRQLQMRELLTEEAWPIVEKKLNRLLSKMGVDSELEKKRKEAAAIDSGGDFTEDGEADKNGLYTEITSHEDDSAYNHSRTDDASAVVRYLLSSIPDERFATQEDIDLGIVDKLRNDDGSLVTLANGNNVFGIPQFLGMKKVSNLLLAACHHVKSAQQLDSILQLLSDTNPVFQRLARIYHSYYIDEIKKHPDGKHRIQVNGKEIDESEYEQHLNENGVYYTWVKDGSEITSAKTLINRNKESFVTQLLNYVSVLRHDFIRVSIGLELDENGDPQEGKYIPSVKSSDETYASSVYPKMWFARFASGISGVFDVINGKYKYAKGGERLLQECITTLEQVRTGIVKKGSVLINNKKLNINKESDFNEIVDAFINAINILGIDINKEQFIHGLRKTYEADEKFIPTYKCFGMFIASSGETNNKISYKKFVEEIKYLQSELKKGGNNTILYINRHAGETVIVNGKKAQTKVSGMNLYSDNAIVKWFASAVSNYLKSTTDLMLHGPESTKRYVMAQSSTASDFTDDMNETHYDSKTKKIINSKIISDMRKYIYNLGKRIDLGGREKTISCLILKHFANKEGMEKNNGKAPKLILHTHGGVQMEGDYTGGMSYKKITEREDYIAKAAILQQGGILFPTLSDKSTWFYITGIRVPGINYDNIEGIPRQSLLNVGILPNTKDGQVHVLFNNQLSNAQIDQMIEYAYLERNAIELEINRKSRFPRIEFFEENRKRFGALSEIVIIDKNGKTKLIPLNDQSKSPQKCLEIADMYFFGNHIPMSEKRKIMALTLEEGFLRNIAFLERSGLIEARNNLMEPELDKKGKPTGKKILSNRLFQYRNVGLPSDVIEKLRERYIPNKNLTGEAYSIALRKAESLAICLYVWDIYMRGVISNEETERMYTGAPFFFKWKYGKVKNPTTDKDMHVLIDRHSDQSKRLGGLGSTGERNRLDLADIRRTYRCAEVEDKEIGSRIYESLETAFIRDTIKLNYYTLLKNRILDDNSLDDDEKSRRIDELSDNIYSEDYTIDRIKQELQAMDDEANLGIEDEKEKTHTYINLYNVSYEAGKTAASSFSEGKFKEVDGAAYISPKMAEKLLRMRGVFTEKVAEAFDYLNDEHDKVDILRNREAYELIMKALLGAEKYSAYGYRMVGDPNELVAAHFYHKYALFPLFKQIAYGFSGAVLQKMEKDDVDMLMMHSAVKTGSQDAVEVREDMFESKEQFDDFHFNTYESDFAFVRRLLNTDPHETDEGAMGTQMTKIALSNLDPNKKYTTSDGKTVRGRELLNTIMTAINKLSDIGYNELKELFFKPNTEEIDIDKFSIFLEEELESRDADENLIDAIQVEEVDVLNDDGDVIGKKKQFKLPLEAVSSVDWILSIIVSKINKKVVDINVEGNAFYQRSVWASEGHPTVLSENVIKDELNGGKPLRMINEEGSMDAVISIDYFYNVIPKEIRYNFKKSKQWLIDNGFISGIKTGETEWSNASAKTIAFRIPTQAQSSIHALRFVDVLPAVRATVVLPSEFTAITGSDFDIDKLYMVSLSYKVKTKTTKKNDKVYKKDTVTDQFEKGSKKYYNNLLINSYLTLLKHHGKMKDGQITEDGDMGISMRPVDSDTEPIKTILKRIEGEDTKERSYAYKFGNLAFLVMTKAAFMVGKFGIGPFALNNNNQILTQLFGVRFNDDGQSILSQIGCTRLDIAEDKQNMSKLSWLSGLINAHVDVAKDPYIQRLNVNTFTYNTVNLLIRGGMGERTFLFTSQPIMKELARVYEDASGLFMVDQNKSKSSRLRTAVLEYIKNNFSKSSGNELTVKQIEKMMMGYSNTSQENKAVELVVGSYAKALFGINSDGSYSTTITRLTVDGDSYNDECGICIFEDVLTNKECRKNSTKPATLDNLTDMPMYRIQVLEEDGSESTLDVSPRMVQLLAAYINRSLEKYGQKLSDLVNSCKIDTKKHGKNYVEQKAFLEKYNEVFDNDDDVFELDGLNKLKNDSYIKTKVENATGLYKSILKGFSVLANDNFVSIHDAILKKLNSSSQNKKLSKKVQAAIMRHYKKMFFDDYVNNISEEFGYNYGANLFYGNDCIAERLQRILYAIKRDKDGEFSDYGRNGIITNPLLKALICDIYEEKDEYNSPRFVMLQNALLEDSEDMNALERAWDDLFRDTEHFVEDSDGEKYSFRLFSIDLAVYAFYTSGDQSGKSKFFKYVPNSIRLHIGYSDYMRLLEYSLEEDANNEDVVYNIIKENWTDNDFVKPYRQVYYTRTKNGPEKRHNFVTFASVKNKITTKSGEKTKYGMKWSTISSTKTVRLIIGALRKNKDGTRRVSINRGDDGKYPKYIKVRRPSIDKYASDNVLLYEFCGLKPVDTKKDETDCYPVYKLVLPESGKMKAGSYFYDILNPVGSDPIMYDKNTIDKLDLYFDENGLVKEDDLTKAELLDEFIHVLDDSNIYVNEEEAAYKLKSEFDIHDKQIDARQMEKDVKLIMKQLKSNDEQTTSNKKKTTKKEKPKTTSESTESDIIEKIARSVAEKIVSAKGVKKTNKEKKSTLDDIDLSNIADELLDLVKPTNKKQAKKITSVDINKDEKYKSLKTTSPMSFEKDGILFSSVYQYYTYRRIDFASNISEKEKEELRDEVLEETEYSQLSRISKLYSVNDSWSKNVYSTIKEGLIAALKDSANTKLKKLLLSTGDAEIKGNETVARAYSDARENLREFDDSDISEEELQFCNTKNKRK